MDAPEVLYAKSGEIDIAYSVFGEGPVDLVFVPGFISHQELNWEMHGIASHLRRLAHFCRIVTFDKRGTGLSDRSIGFGSAAERMDDIRAVMDAAGIERASVYGISEGGPLALLFAASYSDRVDRLALYGTFARLLGAPGYDAPDEIDTAALFEWMQSSWGSGQVLESFFEIAPDRESFRRLCARFERNACTPKRVHEIMSSNVSIDVRDVVSSISAPSLVIHRTGDPVVAAWHGRWLAEHLPNAQYIELDGSFHARSQIEADAGDEALRQFFNQGATQPVLAERLLATVVFTDIVGSTNRASAEGDAGWRDLLDAHDDASRREVERVGGRIVKSTGDGCLATFESPARAIDCVERIKGAVAQLGIALRVGVHTGEVERRGNDIGGIGVHIAARLLEHATQGEVVVTRTVRDLMFGSDLRFDDRGIQSLKGIEEPWQIYAVAS